MLQLRDTMLKQIGKFTISERIGRGTYSHVYRAADPHGRPFAIKMSTTPTEQQHLIDFQRDLVFAASVLHPNLASVHDLGFEDEFPYLVMELVEGRDVGKLIQTKADLSLGERIRIMLQVAEALTSAHERGVFHLDVRPSKIMCGDDGTAKLLGLGLGRLSYDESRVTDRGYMIGSPFYMSPERLMSIDTADPQCDIWSFGVTFHEWIAGRHPFFDDDGDRMIGNIMDNQPEELVGVPGSLHRLIQQTLEKDPRSRYRNFAELTADLKPIVREWQLDESDAMLAEALKQTDSGQWHEARRIARQMRDRGADRAPAAQFFGISEPEPEPEEEQITEPSWAVADPVPVVAPVPEPPAAPQPLAAAPPTPSPRPPDNGASGLPVLAPRPTVRILADEQSNGFPWAKMAAFAVAAMLVAGVLFFVWGPYSSVVGKGEISAEAKAISPGGRAAKTSPDVSELGTAPGAIAPGDESADLVDPKPFDPKSLTAPVAIPALSLRQRSNLSPSLKPPPLGENSVATDLAAWPGVLKAPPPPVPAPIAKDSRPQAPTPQAPVAQTPAPLTVEAVQAAAVKVGGSFSQPVLVHTVPPTYPPAALHRKAQGAVRFEATIAKDGSVKNLQVVSGDPLLDVAAKEAVLQWKYRPALLNGEPVEVTQAIVVKFNLSQ